MKQHRPKQIREEKSKEVFVIRTAQSREGNPSTARVSFLTDSGLPIETLPSHLLTKSVDSLDPDFVLETTYVTSLARQSRIISPSLSVVNSMSPAHSLPFDHREHFAPQTMSPSQSFR